jgi:hypothetical protein
MSNQRGRKPPVGYDNSSDDEDVAALAKLQAELKALRDQNAGVRNNSNAHRTSSNVSEGRSPALARSISAEDRRSRSYENELESLRQHKIDSDRRAQDEARYQSLQEKSDEDARLDKLRRELDHVRSMKLEAERKARESRDRELAEARLRDEQSYRDLQNRLDRKKKEEESHRKVLQMEVDLRELQRLREEQQNSARVEEARLREQRRQMDQQSREQEDETRRMKDEETKERLRISQLEDQIHSLKLESKNILADELSLNQKLDSAKREKEALERKERKELEKVGALSHDLELQTKLFVQAKQDHMSRLETERQEEETAKVEALRLSREHDSLANAARKARAELVDNMQRKLEKEKAALTRLAHASARLHTDRSSTAGSESNSDDELLSDADDSSDAEPASSVELSELLELLDHAKGARGQAEAELREAITHRLSHEIKLEMAGEEKQRLLAELGVSRTMYLYNLNAYYPIQVLDRELTRLDPIVAQSLQRDREKAIASQSNKNSLKSGQPALYPITDSRSERARRREEGEEGEERAASSSVREDDTASSSFQPSLAREGRRKATTRLNYSKEGAAEGGEAGEKERETPTGAKKSELAERAALIAAMNESVDNPESGIDFDVDNLEDFIPPHEQAVAFMEVAQRLCANGTHIMLHPDKHLGDPLDLTLTYKVCSYEISLIIA